MQYYTKLDSLLRQNVDINLSCRFWLPPKLCFYSLGPNNTLIQWGIYYPKESHETIHFKGKFHPTICLFSESNMIKLPDKITIENCLFASKSLNKELPEIFNNCFIFSSDIHRYETCPGKGIFKVKSFNTKSNGREAVIYSAINTYNSL